MNRICGAICIAILIVTCSRSTAETHVYLDGEFDQDCWQSELVEIGDGGSADVTTEPEGGNPHAYRHFNLWIPGTGDEARVFVLQKYLYGEYAPAIHGSIASIDYSEDAIIYVGDGQGQSSGPCIWQGDDRFFSWFATGTPDTWTHFEMLDLTAENFALIDPALPGGIDHNVHPNFTVLGAPICVGFWRGIGTYGSANDRRVIGGLDNWELIINAETSSVPHTELTLDLSVTPNPSDGFLEVAWSSAEGSEATLHLFDSQGRCIKKLSHGVSSCGGNRLGIALREASCIVSPGIYFLRLTTEVGSRTVPVTFIR